MRSISFPLLASFLAILCYNYTDLAPLATRFTSLLRATAILNSPPNKTSFPFFHPASFSTHSANMSQPRKISKSFLAVSQSEGAGARVRRSIGTPAMRQFSPFLMLDHFTVRPGAGFPDHPHRGQETITYLLEGAVDHEDFAGHRGTIWPGDLQFMTAGRGIVHAEMPNQGFGDNVGLQLWVDLPRKLKMCEPRYRDLRKDEIPVIQLDEGRVTVKVISGISHGTESVQELAYTPVWLFDVEIRPGGRVAQEVPEGWHAFAYSLEGTVEFGVGKDKKAVPQYHNTIFESEGNEIVAEVSQDAKETARFSEYLPPPTLL